MEKVPQKPLGCSLIIALKEVKAGQYGEDGHVFEEPVSKGIAEKVPDLPCVHEATLSPKINMERIPSN